MAFQNSHAPYQVPQEYLDLYPNLPQEGSQRCFNAMCSALDESVGVIADALHTTGMYSNTVIVYSSDNGGPAKESNNLPLRGAKFGVFEGSFRVPAFVHSPLLPSACLGKVSHATIFISDWFHAARLESRSHLPIQCAGTAHVDRETGRCTLAGT